MDILENLSKGKKLSLKYKDTRVVFDSNDNRYILKSISRSKSNFKREKGIYKEFEHQEYFFNTVKLIESTKRKMLLEFVEGENGWNRLNISKTQLVEELLNLNFHESKFKTKVINGKGIIVRTPLLLLKSKIKISEYFKLNYIVFSTLLKQKKIKPLFMHNDLFGDNNFISTKNEIYFIDFESSGMSNKFILKDIVDMSFRRKERTFDWELFNLYLKELRIKYSDYDRILITKQIRVLLINKIVEILFSKASPNTLEIKNITLEFLKSKLLKDGPYQKWVSDNIII